MSDKCTAVTIGLATACFVLLILFILALTKTVGPECMRGTADSKLVRSQFSTRSGGPDLAAPMRPLGEQTSQQNQMDKDLSTLQLSTDAADSIAPLQDYDPAGMSLEKSVFDSHREFVEDSYISTQGANSTDSVRDDAQDINPRVGLRKIDYTSAFSESDARVVSSSAPDQLAQTTGTYVI
jgi:hypothetical protein